MGLLSLFSSLLFFSSTILNVGSRQPAEDIFGLKRFCKYIHCELDTSWGAIPFERHLATAILDSPASCHGGGLL
uniref:Secreted protein n=1 Tax=Salix viminalis TaxID=40686 RepID=A0A6N2L303_SALVM